MWIGQSINNMKFIIAFLLLFSTAMQAQSLTKDSVFVTSGASGRKYVTNQVTASNGQQQAYRSTALDTASAQYFAMAMFDGKMNAYVNSAQRAFSLDALVKPMIDGEAQMLDTLGTLLSPHEANEERYKSGWIFSDWSFNAGSPVTAPIAEDGTSGLLEITISSTDYRVFIGADWIVIKDYPSTGAYTALFRLKAGESQFRNFAQTISLSR